jgi:hypothetical protein
MHRKTKNLIFFHILNLKNLSEFKNFTLYNQVYILILLKINFLMMHGIS